MMFLANCKRGGGREYIGLAPYLYRRISRVVCRLVGTAIVVPIALGLEAGADLLYYHSLGSFSLFAAPQQGYHLQECIPYYVLAALLVLIYRGTK